MTDLTIQLAGESLCLLPERALYWPRAETLFIADAHWGKAAAFRASALPIPETREDDLLRLDCILERTGARRLILLGDLLHAKASRTDDALSAFVAWRETHVALDVLLIRGNHDRRAGDPPESWRVECADAPTLCAPFVLQHEPAEPRSGYALAGHIHPGAVLFGAGRQQLKLPCFWFGAKVGVLPAFGSFTGTVGIRAQEGDRVYVIAENIVIAVGKT